MNAYPFDSCKTEEGPFYVQGAYSGGAAPKPVKFMKRKKRTPFYDKAGVTAISLNLEAGADLQFVTIACNSPEGYRQAWRRVMDFEFLWEIVDVLGEPKSLREMVLEFPKFTQKRVNRFDRISPLIQGCIQGVDPLEQLKGIPFLAEEEVGVEVNEEGLVFHSDAGFSLKGSYGGFPVLRFDRPFLYLVLNSRTRVIYLLGEYLGPL